MKLRITYKHEGDGFRCDALCDPGYTHIFSSDMKFRKKNTQIRDYPLSMLGWCISLMAYEMNTMNAAYTIYISAKFCRDCHNHLKKIYLRGVTRKSRQGLHLFVLQHELQNREEQEKGRGAVIAAELKGDLTCPSLLAISMYATKPVHFLTMRA